ncbi:MAG: hypothetical protein ABWJ42_02735 [Sulfolobales archaeon]
MIKKTIEYTAVLLFPVIVFIIGLSIYPMDASETSVSVEIETLGDETLFRVSEHLKYIEPLLASRLYEGVVINSGKIVNVSSVAYDDKKILRIDIVDNTKTYHVYIIDPRDVSEQDILTGSNVTFIGLKFKSHKDKEIIIARALYTVGVDVKSNKIESKCIYREKHEHMCKYIIRELEKHKEKSEEE